jgi:hypothetical protein
MSTKNAALKASHRRARAARDALEDPAAQVLAGEARLAEFRRERLERGEGEVGQGGERRHRGSAPSAAALSRPGDVRRARQPRR